MLHKTKGLVLRTVKYGETSMIVTVFTELFGLQSCLVNGVRTSSKKNASRASLFQPAALLDLVLYHQETKNLQRLKEFNWHVLYRRIFSEVIPHAVALFMIELLQKNLKQPEAQPDLFYFMEDLLTILDDADDRVIANLPLFFSIHLSGFFGMRIDDNYSAQRNILDLREGYFTTGKPDHPYFLEEPLSQISADLLRMQQPHELSELRLNREVRRNLLMAYEDFYSLHVTGYSSLKSLPVLRTLLEDGPL